MAYYRLVLVAGQVGALLGLGAQVAPAHGTYVRIWIGGTGQCSRSVAPGRSGRAAQDRLVSGKRLTRGAGDLDPDELSRGGQAVEVDDLVVRRAATHSARVGARGAFDEHLKCPSDEPLRSFVGPSLDDLDEAPESLHLDPARHLVGQRGRLRPPARRVGERERAVVADLLSHLERLP